MRMDLGLSQTIKQIQTLSPQMYMSMEILCLNSLDLEDRIDKELEENVALELTEGRKAEADEGPAEGSDPEAPAATPAGTQVDDGLDAFDRKVEQWDRYAREEYDFQTGPRSSYDGEKDEKLEALNNTEGRPMSLQEYLEQQVHLLPDERLGADGEYMIELCRAIIYNIDDRGYLMYSLEEILQSILAPEAGLGRAGEPAAEAPVADTPPAGDGAVGMGLSVGAAALESAVAGPAHRALEGDGAHPAPGSGLLPEAGAVITGGAPAAPAADQRFVHAEDAGMEEKPLPRPPTADELKLSLEIIQGLDPPGVGGRDLKECLLLQLRRDGQLYPIETRIIECHLDDLGQNRLPKIAKALEIDVEEVKGAAETIASLNPIPGKLFGGEKTRFVKPDVIVEELDGRYEVRVESEHLPRLQVSSYYRDLYRNAYKDPELKKFVKKKLESAEWLISAIRQRQSTLQRIAQEIVEIQSGFLDHGISHLKPLKMVEVAERVGVHVSTISRAISGKYIQTPRGIFDLKFFFTGGAVKSDGTMEARGSVIQRIKELIDGEDKRTPLSDIDIVKKLEESDIRISRRTVTKYREAEGIPSSRQRRAY